MTQHAAICLLGRFLPLKKEAGNVPSTRIEKTNNLDFKGAVWRISFSDTVALFHDNGHHPMA
jgi:hypothetical protein